MSGSLSKIDLHIQSTTTKYKGEEVGEDRGGQISHENIIVLAVAAQCPLSEGHHASMYIYLLSLCQQLPVQLCRIKFFGSDSVIHWFQFALYSPSKLKLAEFGDRGQTATLDH